MQREHGDVDVELSPREQAKAIVHAAAREAGITVPGQLAKAQPARAPKPKAAKAQKDETEAKAKREPKPKAAPRPKCGRPKKDGQSCTASVMAAKDGTLLAYCTDHRPAVGHLSAEETAKLTAALKAAPDQTALVVGWLGWGKAKLLAAKLG